MRAYRLWTPDGGEHGEIEFYYSSKAEALREARRMCRDKVSPHFGDVKIDEVRFPTGRGAMVKLANGMGIEHVRAIATVKPRYDYKLDEDEDRWVVYNLKTGKIVGFKDPYLHEGDE